MIRRIIHINEEKCNGCGACADACHESAIGMVNGKAKLLRDDYCDGLGDCLPACPTGAITFEEREAAAYDEAAVMANKQKKEASAINTAQSVPQSNEAKKHTQLTVVQASVSHSLTARTQQILPLIMKLLLHLLQSPLSLASGQCRLN